MIMNRVVLLLLALLFTLVSIAQNRTQIRGSVNDESGVPIQGVTIILLPSEKTTQSDASGRFLLRNVPTGSRTLRFSSVGFIPQERTLTLSAGESLSINVVLVRSERSLQGVAVSASVHTPGEVQRLSDVHQTYLTAGKKNEVITVEGMNANMAEKTGRQLFAKIPGVFVYDMDGSGNQMNISTRGLDPHRSWEYNVRLNGVMTNSDIYGYPASHYSAPMESISRIELVRGSAALQYGAAFGGMINYVNKTADTTKPFSFENISSVGSYGLLSTYNAVGGCSGRWTYYGYYSKRVSEGYRQNARSNYSAQFASVSYRLSDKAELKGELAHMEYLYQTPGPLTDQQFRENPRQSTRSRNYFNPDIFVPSLSLDLRLSPTTRINWTTSAILGKRNSVQFLAFASVADTIDRTTGKYKPRQVDIDGFNSYSTELRLLHSYSTGRVQNVLTTGVRYIHNNLHRRQLGKGTAGTDFDLSLSEGEFGRNLHYKTRNVAFFAENQIKITDRFSLSPGFRYEVGATDMSGTITYYNPGELPTRINHHFPLFGLSGQYTFRNNAQLYGGWTQAYRPVIFSDIIPPTPLDRTDKNLKDASGYNLELGLRSRSMGWLTYDVSFFALQYNNRIGSVVLSDNTGSYVYKTNVGSSLTKGVEVFAEFRPLLLLQGTGSRYRLSLFTSTSYFDAHYQKGNIVVNGTNKSIAGNRLETVPRWISRNGLNVGVDRFNATVQHSYVGRSFSDALNTPTPLSNGSAGPVPSYHLLDVNTTLRVSTAISLKLGVNNLLNKQYFTKRPSGYPGPGVWPSDGRSIVATVSVKL